MHLMRQDNAKIPKRAQRYNTRCIIPSHEVPFLIKSMDTFYKLNIKSGRF